MRLSSDDARGQAVARARYLTRRRLLCGTAALLPVLALTNRPAWAGADSSLALLVRLCDMVIPTTDTPGASAAGVPAFLLFALPHQLFGGTADTLPALLQHLDRRTGGKGFLAEDAARQVDILQALDATTFSRKPPPPVPLPAQGSTATPISIAAPVDNEAQRLWRIIKSAIVTSFYTSESGGSRTLAYDLVPGRYDADIALNTEPYLSNSWIENIF